MGRPRLEIAYCKQCERNLPRDAFYERKSGDVGGLVKPCKECMKTHTKSPEEKAKGVIRRREMKLLDPVGNEYKRRLDLYRRYGITPEQYDDILKKQNGVCMVCKKECETGARLSIDHDHACCPSPAHMIPTCGLCNRGLLCRKCNIGIGAFNDDPALMITAARYVAEYWRGNS